MSASNANEQKSPEYVPPGPVRLGRLVPREPPATASTSERPPMAEPTTGVRHVESPAPQTVNPPEPPKAATTIDDIPAPGWHPPGWVAPVETMPLGATSPDDEEEHEGGAPADHWSESDMSALADMERLGIANVRGLITQECRAIESLLLEKNEKYGNSFAKPLQIFAREVSAEAQVRVRIDDKLSRIANGYGDELDEDTIEDLIGYLILHRVQKRLGM